jgi:hypothetical protein
MIHYVGIRVHPFRGAGCCGPHSVIEAVRLFMRIKFAAANAAEDNEKDVCAATERNSIPIVEAGLAAEIRPRLRVDPSAETLATATNLPSKRPRREGVPARARTNARGRGRQFHSVRTPIISGIKIA